MISCPSSHTTCWNLTKEELEAITTHQRHLPNNSTKPTSKNAYKCVILRGEHSELKATPKKEQFSRPLSEIPQGCQNTVQRVMHGEQCLGEIRERLQKKIRQRAIYLGCILSPGLFLDVIFCLLC